MELQVCIGSACHLKGSYDVIEKLKKLVEESGYSDKILLKASFCLGRCGEFVTVKAAGEFIDGITPESVERIFNETIIPMVERGNVNG